MSASDLVDAHISRHGYSGNGHRFWDLRMTGVRPLTVNKVATINRYAWASITRQTRKDWFHLALKEKVPHLERAHIIVLPLQKDGSSPSDPAAVAPEAKAAIDGLVDARVLPGDDGRYLLSVQFLPPHVCGDDGLHLRVVEVAS